MVLYRLSGMLIPNYVGVGVCIHQKNFFRFFAIFSVSRLIFAINLERWQKPEKKTFGVYIHLHPHNWVLNGYHGCIK